MNGFTIKIIAARADFTWAGACFIEISEALIRLGYRLFGRILRNYSRSIVNPVEKVVVVASHWTVLDNCRECQKTLLPSVLPTKKSSGFLVS
jgi:hypothetical protein